MSSFLLVTNNPPDKVIAVTRFTIVKPLKPAKKPCKKTVQWPVQNGRQTFPKIRKA